MPNNIIVSVIVPTYDRVSVLGKTLDLLCSQSFQHDKYEIVVVDDCSTKDCGDLSSRYHGPPRLRFFRNTRNMGRAHTRNRGIEKARGELLIFVDDDIWVEPEFIEQHYSRHLSCQDDVAIVGAILASDSVPPTAVNTYLNNHHRWCHREMTRYNGSLPFGFCKTANLSIKRRTIETVGFFDASYVEYGSEDTELGYRLKKNGTDILFAPEAIGYHYHDETVESLVTRSMCLGRTYSQLIEQHPEIADPQRREFFIPLFNTGFSLKSLAYNAAKSILFSHFSMRINKQLVKSMNSCPRRFMVDYLIPILRMQYHHYGMTRGSI